MDINIHLLNESVQILNNLIGAKHFILIISPAVSRCRR
jgi:hypothetical protein